MLSDMIREAETRAEVFALLNAFIDSCHLWGKLSRLPAAMATRPADLLEVGQRCLLLLAMLDSASRQLDERTRLTLKEALQVFAAGFERLNYLERESGRASSYEIAAHAARPRLGEAGEERVLVH